MLEAPAEAEVAPTAVEPLAVRPRRRSGWALKQVPDDRASNSGCCATPGPEATCSSTSAMCSCGTRSTARTRSETCSSRTPSAMASSPCPGSSGPCTRSPRSTWSGACADRHQPDRPSLLRRFGRALFKALLRLEVSVKGLDGLVGRLYRGGGWRLFTRTGVLALWALILAGLYGFWVARPRPGWSRPTSPSG